MMSNSHMKSYISTVLLVFMLHGQTHAQWQRMNLPSTARVNSLAISESNIFAGTDGDGIFMSTDNGENWNSMNAGLQSEVIHTIFIKGTTIFTGTETGASVSTNNGLTWDTIDSGLPDEGVWSLAAMNTVPSDSTIFAGTWSGVYTSTNNGKSWEATSLSNTTMPVHTIIVHNNFIFAATLGGGIFYSQSNGFAWKDISIKYLDEHTGTVALIPVYSLAILDTNVIAGAGSGYFCYTSIADPVFTSDSSTSQGNKPILCFASHNAKLFAGNSVGNIFLSNSDGSRWNLAYSLSGGHCIYSLALNNSHIFAGTESGIWRLRYPETSTVANEYNEAPTGFALEQNYPNPFNPTTIISYQLPVVSNVTLRVYDLLGRPVAALVNERQGAGGHSVRFEASDLPSGVYFYSLITDKFKNTKKLILLK
jgi:ligand-binding sensor domain-containing protein